MEVVWLIVGAALGGVAALLALRSRTAALAERARRLAEEAGRAEAGLHERGRRLSEVEQELARTEAVLEHERRAAAEKLALLDQARSELANTFKALSADALRNNNRSFLELARTALERFQEGARDDLEQRRKAVEHLIAPIRESLEKVDVQIKHLETARSEAYGALTEQVRSLAEGQERLRGETTNLVAALRAPAVRGRWGEIQLRRVVEMAGMLAYCDFVEQTTVTTEGRVLRPDLVVRLPGGKNVVVDAKSPLHAYLDALEAGDEETRQARLRDHARQIRDHIAKLSAKSYWEQFSPTPEFVVLFLPGETFFSAALEQEPSLIEEGVNQRVILATPTTLIALLRAVAYGWRQETLAESARAVGELGQELYSRLGTLADHFTTLGRRLDGAVQAYNQAVGSLERRVLVTARRLASHGAAAGGELPEVSPIDRSSQPLVAPELVAPSTPGRKAEPVEALGPAGDEDESGQVRDAA